MWPRGMTAQRKAEVRFWEEHSPGGPDLRLHVGSHTLGGTNDHIGDSVAQAGRAAGVTLPHPAEGELDEVWGGRGGPSCRRLCGCPPLCQLHMSLLASVVCCGTGQLFGDDQLGDVYAVAQQVRDDVLRMGYCTIRIPEREDVTRHYSGRGCNFTSWDLGIVHYGLILGLGLSAEAGKATGNHSCQPD